MCGAPWERGGSALVCEVLAFVREQNVVDRAKGCHVGRIQPVDATHWLNISAGAIHLDVINS